MYSKPLFDVGAPDKQPVISQIFGRLESNVRSYCRTFPVVFTRGEGTYVFDEYGNRWLDFLSSAGALNYGHNHPVLKYALLKYIEENGVVSSLDLHTSAKETFLKSLDDVLLKPRQLEYRCQFCGPTGTNAVEAALKLAKKVTGRKGIVSFTNSYHGMSAGSMSASSSFRRRNETYMNPDWVTFLPFDGFCGLDNQLDYIRAMLTAPGSGIGQPAAFLLELVQAEGGVNIASTPWVQQVRQLAKELGAVFIVDEIQSGCGRTGKFFCFEHHDISPDIVCVSKSISGFGLPMSILLIAPRLDIWKPGEHNGTFRGFNYSFITGAKAIEHFWGHPNFMESLTVSIEQLHALLDALKTDFPEQILRINKVGMIAGIKTTSTSTAAQVQQNCFANGLILETCGPDASTLKLLPPLTIDANDLEAGIQILRNAFESRRH